MPARRIIDRPHLHNPPIFAPSFFFFFYLTGGALLSPRPPDTSPTRSPLICIRLFAAFQRTKPPRRLDHSLDRSSFHRTELQHELPPTICDALWRRNWKFAVVGKEGEEVQKLKYFVFFSLPHVFLLPFRLSGLEWRWWRITEERVAGISRFPHFLFLDIGYIGLMRIG